MPYFRSCSLNFLNWHLTLFTNKTFDLRPKSTCLQKEMVDGTMMWKIQERGSWQPS